jgi:predicted ArsR family transcriptional regulator
LIKSNYYLTNSDLLYNSFMSSNTRQKIIGILEKNGVSSAALLSAELGLTKANIQYHLQKLMADNTIEALSDSSSAGEPGRPRRFFRLMQDQRPENLIGLLTATLDELSATHGRISDEILMRIAERLAGESTTLPPVPRFNQVVNWLNKSGYQSHWETHQKGPCFIYRNCPYAAIWPRHPELCILDQAILHHLTGFEVVGEMHIYPQKQAAGYCVFRLLSQ